MRKTLEAWEARLGQHRWGRVWVAWLNAGGWRGALAWGLSIAAALEGLRLALFWLAGLAWATAWWLRTF